MSRRDTLLSTQLPAVLQSSSAASAAIVAPLLHPQPLLHPICIYSLHSTHNLGFDCILTTDFAATLLYPQPPLPLSCPHSLCRTHNQSLCCNYIPCCIHSQDLHFVISMLAVSALSTVLTTTKRLSTCILWALSCFQLLSSLYLSHVPVPHYLFSSTFVSTC